jgi:hypothetical protein
MHRGEFAFGEPFGVHHTIKNNYIMMKKLKAAKGRVIITPLTGTPMAGNVRLDNKSRGVHDEDLSNCHKAYCFLTITTKK